MVTLQKRMSAYHGSDEIHSCFLFRPLQGSFVARLNLRRQRFRNASFSAIELVPIGSAVRLRYLSRDLLHDVKCSFRSDVMRVPRYTWQLRSVLHLWTAPDDKWWSFAIPIRPQRRAAALAHRWLPTRSCNSIGRPSSQHHVRCLRQRKIEIHAVERSKSHWPLA